MNDALNRELVRRFYDEVWNRFDKAVAAEILADDLVFRGTLGDEKRGVSGFLDYMDHVRDAFGDGFRCRIQTTVCEGEQAFARMVFSGEHTGEVLGFEPTGRPLEYAGAALFTMREGRIAEIWVLGDLHGLAAQIT